MIVVDASVAVKWFVREPQYTEAETLLATGVVCVAPEHILVEVGQALLRHYRQSGISREQGQQAIAGLIQLLTLLPTSELAVAAFDIAATVASTQYDALYLAAAEQIGADLITSDEKLLAKLVGTRWERQAVHLADWRIRP